MKKFKINGLDKKALDDFLMSNEHEVWCLIIDAVEECVENDLDERQVFEIEPEIDKLFVFRNTFQTTLETGLKIFEGYEDYENCAKCQKIINEL